MSIDIDLYSDVDLGGEHPYHVNIWEGNITHNISPMWNEAGIWDALYMSDGKKAGEIIETLKQGYSDMINNPEKYKKLDPQGNYEGAISFLGEFLTNCIKYPQGKISVNK